MLKKTVSIAFNRGSVIGVVFLSTDGKSALIQAPCCKAEIEEDAYIRLQLENRTCPCCRGNIGQVDTVSVMKNASVFAKKEYLERPQKSQDAVMNLLRQKYPDQQSIDRFSRVFFSRLGPIAKEDLETITLENVTNWAYQNAQINFRDFLEQLADNASSNHLNTLVAHLNSMRASDSLMVRQIIIHQVRQTIRQRIPELFATEYGHRFIEAFQKEIQTKVLKEAKALKQN